MIPSLIAPILNQAGKAFATSGWGSDRTGMSGRDPSLPAIHKGLDFPAPEGTTIYAVADGIVAGTYDWGNKGGLAVVIDHPGGLRSRYLHVSKFEVKKGDRVQQGQLIAKSGSTGIQASSSHLHFDLQVSKSLLSEWIAKFGQATGMAATDSYTSVPAETVVPATLAPKVKTTAAKYGVMFYASTGFTAMLVLALGLGWFMFARK